MKKLFTLFMFVAALILCNACDNSVGQEADNNNTNNDNNTTTENSSDHEDSSDYSWDSTAVINIILDGSTITSDAAGLSINGTDLTITSAATYRLNGSLDDGRVIVNTEDNETVRLILDSVSIHCSTNSPLYIAQAKKTIIILAHGTQNKLSDGSNYIYENNTDDEPNAALFSKDNLTIYGTGSLEVNAAYNDGITSKDGLVIRNSLITIAAKDDGIVGKDYLMIKQGNIKVTCAGDGLKSDNTEDASLGFIEINQATLDVTSLTDAIDAQTDVIIHDGLFSLKSGGGSSAFISESISAKGIKGRVSVIIDDGDFTINSADDGIHSNNSILINGGSFSIATGDDGLHADNSLIINGGTILITKSVEGVESNYITVNGGHISVVSSDDSFNSTAGSRTERDDKSCTYINGGYIVLNASRGDGLDSNGSLVMTAGTVIIHGPSSQPEVMIDYNGTFKMSGGFLASSGSSSNMTQAPSSSSTQCALKIMFSSAFSASTLFHIQDNDGNNILTFSPLHRYQSVVFSSPALQKGKTYIIYKGGRSSGTDSDGLYTDGSYSGGTEYTRFTISDIITSIRK